MRQTARTLIGLIESILQMEPGRLFEKTRVQEVVVGRRIFYVLMRARYKNKTSFAWLGKKFNQDHATVINAIKKHHREVGVWKWYGEVFSEVSLIFQQSANDQRLETKGGVIKLLEQKLKQRIELEKDISDLETLLKTLDKRPTDEQA